MQLTRNHRPGPALSAALVAWILACPAVGGEEGADLPPISARALLAHVKFLASDELEGRKAGSGNERIAGLYIASSLEAVGVEPPPGAERYQRFAIGSRRESSSQQSLNVLGWIEGSSPELKREVLVLGAHLDHLGRSGKDVYLGAEDNASGVAVVLEVASALEVAKERLGRSVLVAFFGAEEVGLLGSLHFVSRPPLELNRVAAMINIDMIGRPLADQIVLKPLKKLFGVDDQNGLGVVGARDHPLFRQATDAACARAGVQPFGTKTIPFVSNVVDGMAKNRGDDAPFQSAGVPTLFFGSGESDDYHKRTDTVEKLLPELMARRAQALHAVIISLSRAPRPEFALPAPPAARAKERQDPRKGN